MGTELHTNTTNNPQPGPAVFPPIPPPPAPAPLLDRDSVEDAVVEAVRKARDLSVSFDGASAWKAWADGWLSRECRHDPTLVHDRADRAQQFAEAFAEGIVEAAGWDERAERAWAMRWAASSALMLSTVELPFADAQSWLRFAKECADRALVILARPSRGRRFSDDHRDDGSIDSMRELRSVERAERES